MDAVKEAIAAYAVGLAYAELTPGALHGIRRRLIDTIGCGMGGFSNQPVDIAREIAPMIEGDASAHIWFTKQKTSVEMAAFVNALMVRYLDFNDTYLVLEGGHPSDVIAPTLAVAEGLNLSGQDALMAVVVAFETVCSLAEAERLAPSSIDHSLHVAIGSAAGASRAMRLGLIETGHAVSIAVTSNVSLKAAREGQLSMWKAGSAANAAKNGVFAARLASHGMTGPEAPFVGKGGLIGVIGEAPEVPMLGGWDQPFHTERSSLKYFPAQYNAQAAIWAALDLRSLLGGAIPDRIHVATYGHAVRSSADVAKWDVRDRETADHSIPYLVAVALLDGEVTPAQFAQDRIVASSVQDLISRVSVTEDFDMTASFPSAQGARITATVGDEEYVSHVPNAKGHANNPLSDNEVESKFRRLALDLFPENRVEEILTRLWMFDAEPGIAEWAESLSV